MIFALSSSGVPSARSLVLLLPLPGCARTPRGERPGRPGCRGSARRSGRRSRSPGRAAAAGAAGRSASWSWRGLVLVLVLAFPLVDGVDLALPLGLGDVRAGRGAWSLPAGCDPLELGAG